MDEKLKSQGFEVFPLSRINTQKGAVWKIIKNSDVGYVNFGEVYISEIIPDVIKGWKRHREATLNLVVVNGTVEFVIYDDRENSLNRGVFTSIIISSGNSEYYSRLCVKPGLWMAFRSLDSRGSLVMNVMDIIHSDNESDIMDLKDISYKW